MNSLIKKTLDFLQFLKASGSFIKTDNFWIVRKWISSFSKNQYISSKPHYPDWQRRIFRFDKSIAYSGQIHEATNGLTHYGYLLQDACVYHLDLFIKSELQRQEKVNSYMKSNPKDGMPHFYLPDASKLTYER